MQLHAHVGAALEAIHDGDLESHSAELAHHFLQAAPAGLAEKAVAYAVRAAERAMRQLAYEEAVNQYGHALQALDQLHPLPARQHCELRLALADALWQAGESPRARENFLHAAQSARAQGAADLLARAALGLGRVRAETGLVDDELVGLLEAALAALSPDDSALRARTLARLAMALYFSRACAERRDALSMQALAMAQRVGDAGALAFALLARHFVLWGAGSVTERLALATEVVRLAEAGGDLGVAMEGRAWRILALLELGDIAAVDQEIEGYARQSFRLRLPRNQWYLSLVRSARAFLAGRFVEGEQLAVEAAGVRGEGGELANAGMFFGAQLFTLRREQGRLGELEPALTAFAAQFEALPIWRCSLAVFFAELGDHDRARRELEHLAAQDFAALPHDANRLPALALLSEACSMLGDAQRAALLYETLLPYAARNIVVATAAICYGPAARYLGLLASTLARWDDAEVHFADALAMAERMGARPWTAHTRHDHARMLMARGAPGDRRMAGELLEQAQASAGELGMQALEDKVRALRHQIAASRSDGPARASLEPPISRSVEGEGALPPDASVFRREGDYWTIAYQHRVLRLRDCAGARYLSHLLQHPYREFHAFELVDLGSPPRRAAAFAARSGGPGTPAATGLHVAGAADAGPVLDSKTRAAYKRRLADLRSELDEARDFNDIGRIDHLQHEAAFLSQELAAGLGLNQQYRRAASSADQARVNVTRAIKRAIQKIAGQHRALGLHLANAINTGLFCSYLPDPRVPIWWLS